MEHYELLIIIPSKIIESEAEKFLEKIKGDIKACGGEITLSKNLGKKKFSYPIQQMRYGYYLLCEFNLERSKFSPLDKQFSLNNNILRHQIVRVREKTEEEIKKDAERKEKLERAREERITTPSKLAPEPIKRPLREKPQLDIELKEKIPALPVKKMVGITSEGTPAETPEKKLKEKKITLEELDEKLDKILEDDIIDQ